MKILLYAFLFLALVVSIFILPKALRVHKVKTLYDKDKIVDIWNSHHDIFASIANYLKSHGWKKQSYWSVEVKVKEDFKKTIQENINYNTSIFKNSKL